MSEPVAGAVVIAAQGLNKSYRVGASTLPVLQGAAITLRAGETCALMGSSGSGKSTLLHLLGLMDRPDAGEILLGGEPVHDLSARRAAKLRASCLGFVFQQFQLLHELSALENVLLPRRIATGAGWWSRRNIERAAANAALEAVGLTARARHRPTQLSGGEQQRVAIARALVGQPQLLLADEPTGNLDRRTGQEILELLLRLARERGAAVLLATHDPEVAAACQRTLRLREGRVLSS
jgi:predicted ABC-type transport system involved in lysophospholipase L1 biosynthesis ATPase subunit